MKLVPLYTHAAYTVAAYFEDGDTRLKILGITDFITDELDGRPLREILEDLVEDYIDTCNAAERDPCLPDPAADPLLAMAQAIYGAWGRDLMPPAPTWAFLDKGRDMMFLRQASAAYNAFAEQAKGTPHKLSPLGVLEKMAEALHKAWRLDGVGIGPMNGPPWQDLTLAQQAKLLAQAEAARDVLVNRFLDKLQQA